MALPYFYAGDLIANSGFYILNEDTSKHITQVLRMKTGEELLLTDGKGTKAQVIITNDHRKRCEVQIISTKKENGATPRITIAISLLKYVARFEWFLEKATEIGINTIIPLLCERTEKEKFRQDRLQNILVSALLQSQQSWLPHLHEPTSFSTVIEMADQKNKLIAHCLPEEKKSLSIINAVDSSIILIGPEGDFSPGEITLAINAGFQPVTLGNTRLRTETAGMVAAALLRIQ